MNSYWTMLFIYRYKLILWLRQGHWSYTNKYGYIVLWLKHGETTQREDVHIACMGDGLWKCDRHVKSIIADDIHTISHDKIYQWDTCIYTHGTWT